MRPTADEVLDTVLWTFEQQILPNVAPGLPNSLALTTLSLLRQVQLRLRLEAKALWEDNQDLRVLLAAIAGYGDSAPGLDDLAQAIRGESAQAARTGFCGLAEMSQEAEQLRWILSRAMERLHEARSAHRREPAYVALCGRMVEYLHRQIAREAAWIEPAFVGE